VGRADRAGGTGLQDQGRLWVGEVALGKASEALALG
jgi:hypothetical protein